jgi:hypothetical protein
MCVLFILLRTRAVCDEIILQYLSFAPPPPVLSSKSMDTTHQKMIAVLQF